MRFRLSDVEAYLERQRITDWSPENEAGTPHGDNEGDRESENQGGGQPAGGAEGGSIEAGRKKADVKAPAPSRTRRPRKKA